MKQKNKAAVALAKARWAAATDADREKNAARLRAGRAKLSAKKRRDIARAAAKARWAKKKDAP